MVTTRSVHQPAATRGLTPEAADPKTYLLGASILRDVNPRGLHNTTVRSIGGATNERLKQELEGTDLAQYDTIVIQASTNNSCPPATYRRSVTDLIKTVQSKAPSAKLTLSSVCPRGDRDKDKVAAYNREVSASAEKYGVQCIQVESTFLLDDGTLDLSLFHGDRLHLNKKGTSALLKAIDAIIPILRSRRLHHVEHRQHSDTSANHRPRHRPHSTQQRSHSGTSANHRPRHGPHSAPGHHRDAGQHGQVICFHCGVPGHVQRTCRHKIKDVVCFDCGQSGHKSKFCNTYYPY